MSKEAFKQDMILMGEIEKLMGENSKLEKELSAFRYAYGELRKEEKELEKNIEEAIAHIKIIIEIINEQSIGKDEWILSKLNGVLELLGGKSKYYD